MKISKCETQKPQEKTDSSSDVIETRRTRPKSILILQDTKCKEEELKNVQERVILGDVKRRVCEKLQFEEKR